MDISKVDYWATSGTSVLHRATVVSKLIATALVIGCVVITRDVCALLAVLTVVLITVRAARLPVLKVLMIAVFPSLFALLFAISYVNAGWRMPAAVILKALAAASSMILLVSTTPYTELAGFMGRVLPRVVADGLFMTYRSFFIMLQLLDNFIDALRLRGGFRPGRMLANAGNVGSGLGMMFIRSYEKSQKLYDVMSVRGYSGMLSAPVKFKGFRTSDIPYMAVSAVYFITTAHSAWTGRPAGLVFMVLPMVVYLIFMEAARSWKK